MRIQFERTGGFAGRKLRARIDSAALTDEESERLRQLVTESRFFDLPARLQSGQPAPDRFSYVVTVQAGPRTHTIEAAATAVPPELRPLLTWLTKRGRT
jgi:hypothetical protein